jgi:hypothetical protein
MKNDQLVMGIVLIVAVVGLFVMISGPMNGDLTGQAGKVLSKSAASSSGSPSSSSGSGPSGWGSFGGGPSCIETDSGDNPNVKGFHTGTYPWGGQTTQVPDRCRLNNQPVVSCSGSDCKLMEYYCRADGYLFWNFYPGDCNDGAIITTPVCQAASPATSYGIESYPKMFANGQFFEDVLLTGSTAPAQDVLALTDVAVGLQNDGLVVPVAELDTAITTLDQDMVVVGDVCENVVLQDILCYTPATCGDVYSDLGMDSDEAYIGLFEQNGYTYLIVTGEDPAMRRTAAQVVAAHGDPLFVGQSMIVAGPTIIPAPVCDVAEIEDNFEILEDFLEDQLDDYEDALDDLQSLGYDVADLDALWTDLDGVLDLLQNAETEFVVNEDYEDAADSLVNAYDDLEVFFDDFEGAINDVGDAGYDEGFLLDIADGLSNLDDLLDLADMIEDC